MPLRVPPPGRVTRIGVAAFDGRGAHRGHPHPASPAGEVDRRRDRPPHQRRRGRDVPPAAIRSGAVHAGGRRPRFVIGARRGAAPLAPPHAAVGFGACAVLMKSHSPPLVMSGGRTAAHSSGRQRRPALGVVQSQALPRASPRGRGFHRALLGTQLALVRGRRFSCGVLVVRACCALHECARVCGSSPAGVRCALSSPRVALRLCARFGGCASRRSVGSPLAGPQRCRAPRFG